MSERLRIIEGRKHIIKSCRPTKFGPGEIFAFDKNGPIGDREFMVVDSETHSFRTQRNRHPGYRKLALVQPSIQDNHLILETDGFDQTAFPLNPDGREKIIANIWDDPEESLVYPEGSEWFSDFLQKHCLLVRKNARRLVNRPYLSEDTEVSFADRNQIHIISQATIDAFNELLPPHVQVTADNFRPNLVIDNCKDREENDLRIIETGNIMFQTTIPCERCDTPAVDQSTAEFHTIILAMLKKHLKPHKEKPPILGEQMRVIRSGQLMIGHAIHEVDTGEPKRRTNGWARKYWHD